MTTASAPDTLFKPIIVNDSVDCQYLDSIFPVMAGSGRATVKGDCSSKISLAPRAASSTFLCLSVEQKPLPILTRGVVDVILTKNYVNDNSDWNIS